VFQASGFDSKGRPIGVRGICGTARTNQPYGDVNFVVRANDTGEPGTTDEFDIRLVKNGNIVYTTETCFHCWHKLNGGNGGGGNIQLHGPTTGNFSPLDPSTCPANVPPPQAPENPPKQKNGARSTGASPAFPGEARRARGAFGGVGR